MRTPDSLFDASSAKLIEDAMRRAEKAEARRRLRRTANRAGWIGLVGRQVEEGILPAESIDRIAAAFGAITAEERRAAHARRQGKTEE